MNIDKKRLAQMRALCAELGPEDGLSPQELRRLSPERRHDDTRTLRLCGQAARVLNLSLPLAADPRLQGVLITRVEPAPDARRLRARFLPTPDIEETSAALSAATPWLREALARGVRRKRVPQLCFAPEVPE